MARGSIFPSRGEKERLRLAREQDALALARMREMNQEPPISHQYPVFTAKMDRDAYLDRLIGNAYQVKAVDANGVYTVEDIDQRIGF